MSARHPDVGRKQMTVFTSDWRLRDIGKQIEETRQLSYDKGPVFTPDTSIREIVSTLHRGGGVALLSEGTWDFQDGYVMPDTTRSKITLMSVSPGNTVFRRTKTTSNPMLHMKGAEHRISGIRFHDDNATGPLVKFEGDRCSITNCVAEDCHSFVVVSGASWCEVRGNHVIETIAKGVEATGTCAHLMINDNRFESAVRGDAIYLGDNVTSTTIMGNVLDYSGGTISVLGSAVGIPGVMASSSYSLGLHNLNSVKHTNVTER